MWWRALEVTALRSDLGDTQQPHLPQPCEHGTNGSAFANTVLAHGSDILASRRAGYQPMRWMTLWTRCADTPSRLCAGWGNRCGPVAGGVLDALASSENSLHQVCERKSFKHFPPRQSTVIV